MNALPTVGFLVCRGSLSYVEQTCLKSCLARGHGVQLYHYAALDRVPDGVELVDANTILPRDPAKPWSASEFEPLIECFRYRLLKASPGIIWSDTDAYFHQPLRPVDGYLFGWEVRDFVGAGVVALPADSPALDLLLRHTSLESDGKTLEGKGPLALTDALRRTGEISHTLDQHVLYPFGFDEAHLLLRRGYDESRSILSGTCSIHLYGTALRKRLMEADNGFPKRWSLLGKLVKRQNVEAREAPIVVSILLQNGKPTGRTLPTRGLGESLHAAEMLAKDETPDPRAVRAIEQSRRSPGIIAAPRPTDADGLGNMLIMSCMKNEGPYILDWIGYHLSIGVSHFLIYTNDCDDGTVEILDHLQKRGIVTRRNNPFKPGEKPQWVALGDTPSQAAYKRADRYICMDVDEYINVHTGDGTLTALMQAAKDPDLISLTWRFLGCGGQVAFEDRPVTEQFLRGAPEYAPKPHHNWGFKTMARLPMAFRKLGVHRPTKIKTDVTEPVWVNGSGHRMPQVYLEDGWRSSKMTWGYGLVTLNHYAVRSVEAFLVKRDRGRVNHVQRDQGLEYWQIFNRNDEEANSILPAARRAETVTRMLRADPVLADLHDRAVDWHRKKIAELLARPAFRELYDQLAADPLTHDLGLRADLGATEERTKVTGK